MKIYIEEAEVIEAVFESVRKKNLVPKDSVLTVERGDFTVKNDFHNCKTTVRLNGIFLTVKPPTKEA